VAAAAAHATEVADALEGLPARLAPLESRRLHAETALGSLRRAGWRVDALAASLADVATLLGMAGTDARGPALDAADEAERTLTDVEAAAADLPARRDRIRSAVVELRAALPDAARDATVARELLARLRDDYDASCTEDIAVPDDPTGEPLDAAERASTMDIQDWDRAEAGCAQARSTHAAVAEVRRRLEALDGELAEFAGALDGLLEDAVRAVDAAGSRVEQYGAELPRQLKADVRTMRAGLSEERKLAGRPKPPLVRLERSLRQLIEYADALSARAERLHNAARERTVRRRVTTSASHDSALTAAVWSSSSSSSSWSGSSSSSSSSDSSSSFGGGSSSW
jgi:hypothetical protein